MSKLSDIRVLVVEDDEASALLMEEVLSEYGFSVDIAHDGRSALQVASRRCPDIGVLDLGLPDMDGCELARRLRSLPEVGSRVQLVALSGYGSVEDVRAAMAAGFNLHLTKPVLPVSLLTTLTARLPDTFKSALPNART